MSEIKVNKISPRTNCGSVQLGDSGDTITIPAGATITNNGTQTGFGRTGTVDWDTTPKTATFTAVSGDGFFCNTTSGGFTANLPAGVAGAIVSFADYAGTWQTGNLTVSPNGSDNIGGVNAPVILSTEGQSVTFVFADSTQGWINVQDSTSNERGAAFMSATGGTITTSGNCKIHTFTAPGTFTVSQISGSCAANNIVSYVVVAGGDGGGGSHDSPDNRAGGGGGAGGFREVKNPVTPYTASPLDGFPNAPNKVSVTVTSFPITVGAGGTAGRRQSTNSTNGSSSIFSTITAAGGGRGGMAIGGPVGFPGCGGDGGSGGGGSGGGSGTASVKGDGNTPPTTPAQGSNGGCGTSPPGSGGGGGGATAVGGGPTGSSDGGAGGAGATSSINGTPTARAGGGGGGGASGGGAAGGTGGGGPGGPSNTAGTAGTTNTGGGGGGAGFGPTASGNSLGGAGGSGIVIIRYKFQ
jgi:hypothetical protein